MKRGLLIYDVFCQRVKCWKKVGTNIRGCYYVLNGTVQQGNGRGQPLSTFYSMKCAKKADQLDRFVQNEVLRIKKAM